MIIFLKKRKRCAKVPFTFDETIVVERSMHRASRNGQTDERMEDLHLGTSSLEIKSNNFLLTRHSI